MGPRGFFLVDILLHVVQEKMNPAHELLAILVLLVELGSKSSLFLHIAWQCSPCDVCAANPWLQVTETWEVMLE